MWIIKHRHDIDNEFTGLTFNYFSQADEYLRRSLVNRNYYLIVPID